MAGVNDDIMGSTASVSVDQAAMDLLSARQAESQDMAAAAELMPPTFAPDLDGLPALSTPAPTFAPTSQFVNPESRVSPIQRRDTAPDFQKIAIQSALRQTPPPQWSLDIFSQSTREQGRGQKGLASAVQELQAQHEAARAPIIADVPAGFSRFSDISSDLLNADEERLEASLFGRFQSSPLQASSHFAGVADDIAPSIPDPDVLGDDYFASGVSGRTLTPDEFSVTPGEVPLSRFGAMASRVKSGFGKIAGRLGAELKSPYGGLNFAFAGAALLQAGGQYYEKSNSGEYLTPEQNSTAEAGFLPGAFGLAGTLGGAIAGPGGAWAGGIIGAGVGAIAQGVVGANNERGQASREIGDMFTAALGEATGKLKDFSAQAEATGAPLKQLQQTLGVVSSVAPLGQNAIAGAGAMTNALGEYAGANYSSVARQLRDPALFDTALSFGQTGRLSREQYGALGLRAAIEGSAEDLQQDDLGSQRAPLANNEKYQSAQKRLNDAKNPVGIAEDVGIDLLTGNFSGVGARFGRGLQAARQSRGFEENVPGDAGAAERAQLFAQFGEIRQSEALSSAIAADATAGRTGVQISGGSAADIAAQSTGVKDDLNSQIADSNSATLLLQGLLTANKTPSAAPLLRQKLAEESLRRRDLNNTITGIDQDDLSNSLGETASLFGATSATQQAALQSGYYGGQSFAQLQGAENSILSTDAARANEIRREAANPLINPTQRNAMLSQATQIDASATQSGYQFQQSIYAEENGSLAVIRAGRDADTNRAQTFGSPLDVFTARINGLQSDRDQIAQNNSELARGNLTFSQRQDLTRQNIGLQSDLATAPEQARVSAYDAEGSLLSEQQGQSRAGFSRDVRLRGSAAYTDQIAGDDALIRLYGAARGGSPVGSIQRERFGRQQSDTMADRDDMSENAQVYHELPGERTQDTLVEGAFRRARISPFLSGPESNPLTAGNALLSNLQSRLGGAERALSASTDPLAIERNTAIVESYKDKISDFERDRLYNGLLPQEVQSRIGMPGGGAGVAVTPLAALSASYGPYNPTQGSFGAHPSGYHSGIGMAPEGGAAGAWAMQAGIGGTGGGDAASKVAANTDRTNQLIEALIRAVQMNNQHPPMPMGQVGTYALGLNPGR